MNETFRALLEEAQFTYEILGNGVTMLGKANYATKGLYFLSYTSLSTGLERIGKLCIMLDFYIKHNGTFPNEGEIRSIGHDLKILYDKSQVIIKDNNLEFAFSNSYTDKIHFKILTILNSFAKGDRYSNINLLTNSDRKSDSIKSWHEIDIYLFENRVSKKKKEKIRYNAEIVGKLMSPFSIVRHLSESRDEITDVETASFQTGMYEAVSKYRQLYVLQIIRYWVEILRGLQYEAMNIGKQEIPHFSEIFALFNNSDAYFLTRKTFDRL